MFKKRIFKSDKRTSEMKFTGGFIPRTDFNFLSLYCLNKGIGRSLMLRNIILDWRTSIKEKEGELIKQIASTIQQEWKMQKAYSRKLKINDKEQFLLFIKDIRVQLQKKRICELHIDQIINKIIV